MQRNEIRQRLNNIRRDAFTTLEQTTPVNWAEQYRVITSNSEYLGKWKNSNQPLGIKPLQLLGDKYITHVILQFPAQVCKSATILNYAGYLMTHEHQNLIIVHPNGLLSRDFAKKVGDLISDTPILKKNFKETPNEAKLDNMLEKKINGMEVIMVAAGRAQNLAARTSPNVALDEVDELFSDDIQGDKTKIVENRTNAFRQKKIIYTSTPRGSKETSNIFKQYQNSLQLELHINCPECNHSQPLHFDNVTWSGKGGDEQQDFSTAGLACSNCGVVLNDFQRKQALLQAFQNDQWVEKNPDYLNRRRVGINVSQLHNINYPLKDLVFEYLTAKEEGVASLIAFYNTKLAQPFDGEVITKDAWLQCMRRRENYNKQLLPEGIKLLTSGADVQENRIEINVLGHYRDEKWIVQKHIIDGSPMDKATLDKYREFSNTIYETEDGRKMRIVSKAIDSRYAAQQIHEFCSKYQMEGHYAIKGVIGSGKLVDLRRKSYKSKHKYYFYGVNSNTGKDWVFSTMQIHKHTKDGRRFVHLPSDITEEDMKQIFSEVPKIQKKGNQLVNNGYTKIRKANEGLDTLVYALAAERIYNTNWDAYDRKKELEKQREKDNGRKQD